MGAAKSRLIDPNSSYAIIQNILDRLVLGKLELGQDFDSPEVQVAYQWAWAADVKNGKYSWSSFEEYEDWEAIRYQIQNTTAAKVREKKLRFQAKIVIDKWYAGAGVSSPSTDRMDLEALEQGDVIKTVSNFSLKAGLY